MSLIPKSECIPTFEFKTTFTRPSPDGEPPDVRILSHDNGSFTVKKGEPPTTPASKRPKSKPVFNKQELLEFFEPLLSTWLEDHDNAKTKSIRDVMWYCHRMLKSYIEENGGE